MSEELGRIKYVLRGYDLDGVFTDEQILNIIDLHPQNPKRVDWVLCDLEILLDGFPDNR